MSQFLEALEHRTLFSGDMGGDRVADAVDLGRVHAERSAEFREAVSGKDVDDYYQFRTSRSQTISLLLTDLQANANLKVLDADGNLVAKSGNRSSQSEFLSLDLKKGTYYVRVVSADEKRTGYSLQASIGGDEALAHIATSPEFFAAGANDAFDIFVKVSGIKGESTNKDFKNQIEASNYTWSVTRDDTSDLVNGTPGRNDRAKFSDFIIAKETDSATPLLFLASVSGKIIPTVTISLTKIVDGESVPFLTYRLNNVAIGSVRHNASDGVNGPSEKVYFAYSQIILTYTPFNNKGVAGEKITAGWDLADGAKI